MEKILFLHNDRDHKSVVPLQYEVSVCVQPQGACITGVPAVSAYTKLPVLSQSKRKKQKNNRDPVTSRQVAQFPVTQSCL